jgi:hypothetical protein
MKRDDVRLGDGITKNELLGTCLRMLARSLLHPGENRIRTTGEIHQEGCPRLGRAHGIRGEHKSLLAQKVLYIVFGQLVRFHAEKDGAISASVLMDGVEQDAI